MFKTLLVMTGMVAAQAMAANTGVLPAQDIQFTFKISPASIHCREGVKSPFYPSPTSLSIFTAYGSSTIVYPSQFVILNTHGVYLDDMNKTCADFADLTGGKPSDLLDGKAVQHFSETLGKNLYGGCMRSVREDVTLTIAGHEFKGASEFIVSSLPAEACDGK
jgi:hypothetical protein